MERGRWFSWLNSNHVSIFGHELVVSQRDPYPFLRPPWSQDTDGEYVPDDAERPDDDGEHPLAPEDQGEPAEVEETLVMNYSSNAHCLRERPRECATVKVKSFRPRHYWE